MTELEFADAMLAGKQLLYQKGEHWIPVFAKSHKFAVGEEPTVEIRPLIEDPHKARLAGLSFTMRSATVIGCDSLEVKFEPERFTLEEQPHENK